ncbi:hypothetical protein Gogos_005564 [Gossypium gossypioides]|uniref:Uncharacterized protein n=1 Tax=Gossypium gossypioides TaxID=34282 RepID=A0A7J9CWY5_GOSGO|nr:hypothetical protein [Gossypium gossypioides]
MSVTWVLLYVVFTSIIASLMVVTVHFFWIHIFFQNREKCSWKFEFCYRFFSY